MKKLNNRKVLIASVTIIIIATAIGIVLFTQSQNSNSNNTEFSNTDSANNYEEVDYSYLEGDSSEYDLLQDQTEYPTYSASDSVRQYYDDYFKNLSFADSSKLVNKYETSDYTISYPEGWLVDEDSPIADVSVYSTDGRLSYPSVRISSTSNNVSSESSCESYANQEIELFASIVGDRYSDIEFSKEGNRVMCAYGIGYTKGDGVETVTFTIVIQKSNGLGGYLLEVGIDPYNGQVLEQIKVAKSFKLKD